METIRDTMRRFTSKISNSSSDQGTSSGICSKSTEKRGEGDVLNNIICTESEYDTALKELAQELLVSFQDSEVISPADIVTMFGNIEDLFDFHHSRFGPELYHRLRRRESPAVATAQTLTLRFSQLFIDYSSSFDAYFTYIQNRPKSVAFILTHVGDVKAVLDRTGKRLDDFEELLKLPIKRLDMYQDALETLYNVTADEKALKVIQNGLNIVSRQFRYGEALWALEKVSAGGINIKDQLLFRIDDLTVKKEYHLTGRPKFRCVFLFTKCIIITKRLPRHSDSPSVRKGGEFGELKFKGQIDFRQPDKCGVSGLLENEPLFKIFYQCNEYLADVYAFKADSVETRNLWVRDICEVLGLRTQLQLDTGGLSSSFLKIPSIGNRRARRSAEKAEAMKRERLIRHSWPRHILEEVQEAKEAKEGKRRRRFNIESQMLSTDFLTTDRSLQRRSSVNLSEESHL